MKKLVTVLVALIVSVSSVDAQYAPQIPVESVPDFFRLPIGVNFGEVPAVAVNSQGHIFVFSRSNPTGGGPAYAIHAAQLFEFTSSGYFIREHGRGLYAWAFAHGLRIDANDDIWTVDKGSNMVVRMNPEGRVVWVFGRKAESSSEGARPIERRNPPLPPQDGRFREPTDVAFDSQGNIYISDGYINARVAKYDLNGDWVMSWGEPGTGPGQLRTPHSIAIDKDDNVYVGDRSNARIQVFDTDGNFLRMFSVATPIASGSTAVNGTTPTDLTDVGGNGAPNSMCIPPGSDVATVTRPRARCASPVTARPTTSSRWWSMRSARAAAGTVSTMVTTADRIPGTPSQNGESVISCTSQPLPMNRNCMANTKATLASQ